MAFKVTSSFSYTGDLTATLNTLTNVTNVDATKTLQTLSTENYANPNTNNKTLKPNADNQRVFMNQPMSWWLENLNSGVVFYLPYSNFVNWGYKDASSNVYHIDIAISDMLIPNRTKDIQKDPSSNAFTIRFEDKYGMSRTDTRTI